MEVFVLEERGYEHALRGMSYSYYDNSGNLCDWWSAQYPKAVKRAALLAHKGGGHNGFLESIFVWVDINAPRNWWSQMDRYRIGKTQQSTSTMHTLSKRGPVPSDFEDGIDPQVFDGFCASWERNKHDINKLKDNLPESFMQRRMVVMNYMTLQNIVRQRGTHRLKGWETFIKEILDQVQHPEFLVCPT